MRKLKFEAIYFMSVFKINEFLFKIILIFVQLVHSIQ